MERLMYKAAREGDVEFLKWFIQTDNNLLPQTHQNNNIIHVAAKLGHEAFILEALIACHFLASQKNSKGDTPLHVAARAGHIGVVKLLLNFNKKRTSFFRLDSIETPSTTALREMEEGELKLWRMRNMVQSTALHEALRNGHEEVALCLWELDHEMAGLVNCAGESPLYLAAESRCKDVLLQILNFLMSLNSDRLNLLQEAVRGPDGQNPLHAAVLAGSTECIGYLLQQEEILELTNKPDINGKTALHFATAAREIKIIRQLLKRNASSAYLQDTNGCTPLLEAASSGNFYVFQEILQHCPDTIELCELAGRNALHVAVFNNTVQNVRDFLFLPEMKELVNEPDQEGNTPLHLAIKNQNYKMVRKLMATRCVDLRAKNNRGLTALDICESDWKLSYRQSSVLTYLRGHDAPRGRHPYTSCHAKTKNALNHPGADLKQLANTMSVVAALLATLTFAAAFTLPGGYHADGGSGRKQQHNNDEPNKELGSSILIVTASLKVFVLADSLAVCCSMTVVFLLILAMAGDPAFLRSAIIYSKNLLNVALGGTLVAFMTGLYSVISPNSQWIAIIVIIMCSCVPLLIRYLNQKSSTSTPLVIRLLKGTLKSPVTCSPGRKLELDTLINPGT